MSSPAVKKVLSALLRDPANGTCADCKTAGHPRWASWSLGVFICIRCAGIHRSLGTHISKVKSVDLDTWQEEHLRKVVEFGNNAAANAVHECKLSGNHTPDASKLSDFIRSKYELKKWLGSSANATTPASGSNSVVTNSKPERSQEKTQVSQQTHNSQTSLLSQTTSVSIGSGSSSQVDLNLAPPRAPTRTTSTSQAARELNGRPDLKKSILSLYSRPRASATSVASGASNISVGSSTGNSSNSTPGASFSVPAGSNTTASASLEDNELFKNVWS